MMFVFTLMISSILPVQAGFSVRRLGITHVSIGGESSDKDFLEIADRAGLPYPPIETPVSAQDIMKLQARPPFQGKSAAQIQTKVVNIRRSVLCAIDLLRRTDPETAEGLQGLFRAGFICIGLAPADYYVGAAIKNDGKKQFHLEPINIYNLPCERLPLWSPDLFDLTNTLAHEGLHGRQDVLGWRDDTPLKVAKDRQCKEIEASAGEVERATEMLRVIEYIEANNKLPPNARGMYARIGTDLLISFQGNPSGLAGAIAQWKRKLRGIKLRAGEVKTFREAYKRAAELAIAGNPNAPEILAGLRRHRLFQYYAGSGEFGPITRWYVNAPPRVVEEAGKPARVEHSNEMKQLVAPGNVVETFVVNQLNTICTGLVLDHLNIAMIGGIDFADDPGGEDEGVVVGYQLDPATKRILPETGSVLLRSTEMGRGYLMNYNPFDSKFYALQLDSNEICELRDTDDDGWPDIGLSVGYTFAEGRDEVNPGLNLSVGSFYFTDADTAVSTPFGLDTTAHINDPLTFTWRAPGGIFEGQPSEELNDTLEERPGFDGCLTIGSQYAPLRGSPWGQFAVYNRDAMIGEGCLSPHGRAMFHLPDPLDGTEELRIVDTLNACESVIGRAKAPLTRPRLNLDTSFRGDPLGDGFRVRYEVSPTKGLRMQFSVDLDGYEDDPEPSYGSRFGIGYRRFGSLMDLKGFFRAQSFDAGEAEIMPMPDTLYTTPGTADYFDVSKNDNAPPGAKYELVQGPLFDGFNPATKDAFKFYDDGCFDLAYPTFDASIGITYRIKFGSYVSPDITATVLPNMDRDLLRNPKAKGHFGDITFVEALVLHIDDRDYPLYQFALRPPIIAKPSTGIPL